MFIRWLQHITWSIIISVIVVATFIIMISVFSGCVTIRQDVHIFVEDRDIEDQEEETSTEEDILDIEVEGELIK